MGDDRDALLEEIEVSRQRIAELEELLALRDEVINSLKGEVDRSQEEVSELRALLEAQEASINEQRGVISTQSALIDDMNTHIQAQLAANGEAATTSPLGGPDSSPASARSGSGGGSGHHHSGSSNFNHLNNSHSNGSNVSICGAAGRSVMATRPPPAPNSGAMSARGSSRGHSPAAHGYTPRKMGHPLPVSLTRHSNGGLGGSGRGR